MSLASMAFLVSIISVGLLFWVARADREPPLLRNWGIVWFVVAVVSLAVSLALVWVRTPPAEAAAASQQATPEVTSSTCTVYDFGAGDDRVPAAGLTALKQDRDGCARDLLARLATETPREIVLIGRSDKRELRVDTARVYGTNQSLAQHRAEAVLTALDAARAPGMSRLEPIAMRHAAGARNVGATVSNEALARDRSVDIRSTWSETSAAVVPSEVPKRFGLRLNEERLSSGDLLTLLTLIGALSAYLATIRVYLGTVVGGNRLKIRKSRAFITLADFPMIASAFCLGMHVFLFWRAEWLRIGMVLFLYGGFVMVLMHCREWLGSVQALFIADSKDR